MFLLCRIGLLTVTLNTNLNALSTVQSIKNLYLTLFKHIHNQCYCLLSLQDQLVYIIVQLHVDSEFALYVITKCMCYCYALVGRASEAYGSRRVYV